MKNIDACILINRETIGDDDERQYLGFKLEKFRGKPNKDRIYLFLHPFDETNGILLTSDIDKDKPLSRLRMEDFDPFGGNKVLSGKGTVSFSDYDESSNEFLESLKDIITDDYTDSAKNYVDIYKNAEEVTKKMKKLNQMETDLRERRKNERKNQKEHGLNYERDEKGRVIIKDRKKKQEAINNLLYNNTFVHGDKPGRVLIHSRSKKE